MIGDGIDVATVRPVEIAAELEVVGRIGEDHVDAGVRQAAHRLDAVACQDLAQRQAGRQSHLSCGARTHPFLQHCLYHVPAIAP